MTVDLKKYALWGTLLLALLFLVLGAALLRPKADAPPLPTPMAAATNTPVSEATPTVSLETANAVADAMGWTLDDPIFQEQVAPSGYSIRYFRLYGVSSGNFYHREANDTLIDLLDVYVLLPWRRVIAVPVAIGGVEPEQGQYAYFSAGHQETFDRQEALQDAYLRYARGQEVNLMALGEFVGPGGFDWSKCTGQFPELGKTLPDYVCDLGRSLEQQFPDTTRLLTIRLLDAVPGGWYLIGWVWIQSDRFIALPQE